MDEVLTRSEIESRYPSEWILIADPEVDQHLQVVRGRVVCHSKDRDEVDRKAIELRPQHAAYLYTGKMPEGTEMVLPYAAAERRHRRAARPGLSAGTAVDR